MAGAPRPSTSRSASDGWVDWLRRAIRRHRCFARPGGRAVRRRPGRWLAAPLASPGMTMPLASRAGERPVASTGRWCGVGSAQRRHYASKLAESAAPQAGFRLAREEVLCDGRVGPAVAVEVGDRDAEARRDLDDIGQRLPLEGRFAGRRTIRNRPVRNSLAASRRLVERSASPEHVGQRGGGVGAIRGEFACQLRHGGGDRAPPRTGSSLAGRVWPR